MTYEQSKAELEKEYFIVREGRTVHRRDTGARVPKSLFVSILAAPYRYGPWNVVNYAYSTAWLPRPKWWPLPSRRALNATGGNCLDRRTRPLDKRDNATRSRRAGKSHNKSSCSRQDADA